MFFLFNLFILNSFILNLVRTNSVVGLFIYWYFGVLLEVGNVYLVHKVVGVNIVHIKNTGGNKQINKNKQFIKLELLLL